MSNRRARVDALTDDVTSLTQKVTELHEELERALEELEEPEETDTVTAGSAQTDSAEPVADGSTAEPARADGGNVGWQEIETAGPDGTQDAETVEWTPVETE